jgi:predicted transcriptional regulator of viral defense system
MKSNELLEKLKEINLEIFTAKDIEYLSGKKPYNILKRLKKNNKIEKIKNGVYSLKNTDDMIKATRCIEPSYISFLSALNYYNLTEQIPIKIQLVTTKRKKHKDYDFTTIKKDLFFGYININGIIIAEKEKAIIDSLYLPKQARGIKEIKLIIKNNLNKLNKKKLIRYANKNIKIKNELNEILK